MKWRTEPSWKVLSAIEKTARQEVEEEPHSAGRWRSLIDVQKRLGRLDLVEASLDRANAAFGQSDAGRKTFLTMLLEVGEGERALAVAEELIAARPDDGEIQAMLARAIVGLDRWTAATRRAHALIAGSPHADTSHNQAFHAADTDDKMRAFVARRRAELLETPGNTNARCFLAHALAHLGDEAEARAAMDLDNLISVDQLPAPDGYASAEHFRATLAEEIRRNPTLTSDPRHKATRDGRQTLALGSPDEPAVAALINQIKAAVEAYVAAHARLDDAFIAAEPREVCLSQWAVVYGASGRQTPHRHPAGWLSGVYYVSAPLAQDDNAYLGALLVGEPLTETAAPPPWGIRRIEPVPGRLVLFPSFVPHGTEACGIDGERIVLAFDVMPAPSSI